MMSSMRGGFRTMAGTGPAQARAGGSPLRRIAINVLTAALVIVALVMVLRRFGVIDW
jgi:hypothetical protein